MFWFICHLFTAFPTLSSTLQRSLTSRQISAYSFARLCSRDFRHSRHADEGRVAAVEEGAVDDLQDEGEVLQRQEGDGGAEREQQALQRRQEEGEDGGLQVGVLLTLPCEQPPVQPSVGGGTANTTNHCNVLTAAIQIHHSLDTTTSNHHWMRNLWLLPQSWRYATIWRLNAIFFRVS